MKFILKTNGSESKDAEFVGWTPMKCTLTIDGYSGDTPMPVTITPEHLNKNGRIDLYLENVTSAIPVEKIEHDFQSKNELTFYVAGKFDHASIAEKDTYILVKHDSDPNLELKKEMMVRVRKNANKLDQKEMTMFLEAFVRLGKEKTKKEYQGNYSNYPKKLLGEIVLMHTYDAIWEIHQRTSFHPWHRIFNMHLERELQAIKPHVTIPYWKFDKRAPRVFTASFIGETAITNNPADPAKEKQPKFNQMNPMFTYSKNTAWGTLNRAYRNRNPASQDTFGRTNGNRDVLTEEEIIDNGPNTFEQWSTFEEVRSHNSAHNVFTGDVADPGKDPIDPLFFMMHSNVDRLWAKWQEKYNRFDASQIETYPHQNKYQGKRGQQWLDEWHQSANQDELDFFNAVGFIRQTNQDIGNFVDDTLWPWDLDTNDSRPMRVYNAAIDPEFGAGRVPEIEIEFPNSPTSNFPNRPITVGSTIDYQNRLQNNTPLGFDYDDIPYFDHDRTPLIELATDESLDKILFEMDIKKHNLALEELRNKGNNLSLRRKAIASIDETSEDFVDAILEVIEDPSESEELRAELIDDMLNAKRSNRFFPSRKARFFNQLRGLLEGESEKLRFKALETLAANEDPIVQEFLVNEIKNEQSAFISKADAIFFLQQSPKPQHSLLLREVFKSSDDHEVRRAAIEALGSDPESIDLLKSVVNDSNESFKVREAGALSLHHLDTPTMNRLAAQMLAQPEPGDGLKLFKSASPNPDEVDFKSGLLNMLTFTGDVNELKENEGLKSSLQEVVDPGTQNKAIILSTIEAFGSTPIEGPTIIEQMAAELLSRLESNSDD